MGTEQRPEQDQEQYSFIEEVIKTERMDGRTLFRKAGARVLLGGILGISAALGFVAFQPWAKKLIQTNSKQVEILYEEPGVSDTTEDSQQPSDQYVPMLQTLRKTASEAEKSIVQVINMPEEARWDPTLKEEIQETSGLIVADNGYQLLILVNHLNMEKPNHLQVVFADGTTQTGSIVQHCGNLNISIVGIEKSAVDKRVLKQTRIASWGNSNALEKDAVLLALGAPHGAAGGISYEILRSAREVQVCADGEYPVLVTSSGSVKTENGFLFDIYGNVIGVIDPELAVGHDRLAAWGITALKHEVGLMLNAKPVPYIGIIGTWITPEMEAKLNIPKGIYVKSVEMDSPAMKAGIQTGDVILEIDGVPIETLMGYHNQVMKEEVGKQITLNGVRFGAEEYVTILFDVTVGVKN